MHLHKLTAYAFQLVSKVPRGRAILSTSPAEEVSHRGQTRDQEWRGILQVLEQRHLIF